MPRKKSKPTDRWTELLQQELAQVDERPAGGRTFVEITKARKAAGLPYGWCNVYRWLRDMQDTGKLSKIDTVAKSSSGRKVRRVYYITK